MKLGSERNTEPGDEKKPENWADFFAKLLRLTYSLSLFYPEQTNSDLSASKDFLSSKIQSINWYDQSGKKHTITKFSDDLPTETPKKIITKVAHIELEYMPSHEKEGEKIEARGARHDMNSAQPAEIDKALAEKALSAMSLAHFAKINGWTEVNFDQTSDPIERQMLIMACDKLGISYGDEKVWESTQGVEISMVDYTATNDFWKKIGNTEKFKDAPDKANHIEDIAMSAFLEFSSKNEKVSLFSENHKAQNTKQGASSPVNGADGPTFQTGAQIS